MALTDTEILAWKLKLDNMSQIELAELQRFAPPGHPVFDSRTVLYPHFAALFRGLTPEISKSIGWDR